MEFSKLEEEAQRKAAQHVANMLHTPDKLEKVHQMKWNASRKKASVEAMLKTAMQSQLDGVQTGLGQLETALTEIREVSENMEDIETGLKELPYLVDVLDEVKRETSIHSQLATARENLKNLFTVPEVVKQTEQDIMDGKLLTAHKALAELENSRDDLLLELHKLKKGSNSSTCSNVDEKLLNDYFDPVVKLNTIMEKQIRFVLRRTLNTVRKDPKMVVTAMRIVEREEKLDNESEVQQKATGFIPPGRPKQWKKIALQVLRQNVVERIEGNQLDEREQNKMWLVRHLELIRQITLEDLRVAKSLCQPVFPPEYNIYEHFISLYNEALANRLNEIIMMGLKDQEYVSILSWIIQTYPGKELMGNERLQLPKETIKPLLDIRTIEKLEEEYLSNMKDNYVNWMGNTMKLEKEDWMKQVEPEVSDGTFHTSAPKMIYQMIEENLQVAATISTELTNKVLALSMGEVANFGKVYRSSITDYKSKYFNDRNAIAMFTRYMIAIINNCGRFEDLAKDIKQRWWKSSGPVSDVMNANFESVLKIFSDLRQDSIVFLLDEAFIDIDIHFTEILSPKWSTETRAVDIIIATLEDYFGDYSYLRTTNIEKAITEARDRCARRYISAILTPPSNVLKLKKSNFESPADRRKAAEKIKAEAAQLKRFFRKIAEEHDFLESVDFDSPFDAVSALAEVLNSDSEMLFLDIGTLVKRYPDVSQEQLYLLLLLRGDLNKTESRQMATEFCPEIERGKTTKSVGQAKSVFSQVIVATTSSNVFAEAASAVASATANREKNLNPFGDGF